MRRNESGGSERMERAVSGEERVKEGGESEMERDRQKRKAVPERGMTAAPQGVGVGALRSFVKGGGPS